MNPKASNQPEIWWGLKRKNGALLRCPFEGSPYLHKSKKEAEEVIKAHEYKMVSPAKIVLCEVGL